MQHLTRQNCNIALGTHAVLPTFAAMLIFSRQPETGLQLAVWHLTEPEDFFTRDLTWSADESAELAAHHSPSRRMEWMASRWLLHRLTGATERLVVSKNATSRPFFQKKPDLHCSLSHSHGVVAALTSDVPCGCDLQVVVEKIVRIAPKFMRPDELAWVDAHPESERLVLKHVFWSAKEALYKTYGLRELDFRQHLYLAPFEWQAGGVATTGWVRKGGFEQAYRLYVGHFQKENLPEWVWAVAREA
jgi:4'-phosphopantetheinyl transferase